MELTGNPKINMSKRLICLFSLFLGWSGTMLLAAVPKGNSDAKVTPASSQIKSIISPKVWLETETNALLDRMDEQLATFKSNPQKLETFLYDKSMTFWDSAIMARGLAGRYWYKSSQKTKDALQEQWKWTLIRYFLKAFPFYDGQRLHLENKVNCHGPRRCWLRTAIKIAGKGAVNVDLYAHLSKPKSNTNTAQWKLIDIRIAGVSLIKHKKGETRQLLNEKGLSALIAALYKKNEKALVSFHQGRFKNGAAKVTIRGNSNE